MKKPKFSPESLMMSYGYNPLKSQGAIKSPIFQTSTFEFKTAEQGKAYFELAYGKREPNPGEEMGLIYSRISNPDLEILEKRLCLWDEAEEGATFESGMSAISTTLLEMLNPGDVILHSEPLYGGSDHFIRKVLPKFGIRSVGFIGTETKQEIIDKLNKRDPNNKLGLIYLETPANPTNDLIDIAMLREIADWYNDSYSKEVPIAVDNTYMGPLWQHPLKLGADLVLYSATKYIGGHSDVIAGACLGSSMHITRIKALRTFLGCMPGPWTSWLLLRSLETLKVRMDQQAENASIVADLLNNHPKVEKVYYLGNIKPEDGHSYQIFKKQCLGNGAMIAFDIVGKEAEAFKFLNALEIIKLAVSLGSTESLAEHPATMTHSDVEAEIREKIGVRENMVRLSVGVENAKDLVWDIKQALDSV